jgi:hypothetical protein
MNTGKIRERLEDVLRLVQRTVAARPERITSGDLHRKAMLVRPRTSQKDTVTVTGGTTARICIKPERDGDWASEQTIVFTRVAKGVCRAQNIQIRVYEKTIRDRTEIDLPHDKAEAFFSEVEFALR